MYERTLMLDSVDNLQCTKRYIVYDILTGIAKHFY